MPAEGPYELFLKKFPEFTEIQNLAFKSIEAGENCLLISPTGSGKTEAALLPVLNRLYSSSSKAGIQAIYVTPLRALNRDLLKRLSEICGQLGISIAVRHGDTSQKERQAQVRRPPQLLITTPETIQNLFLSATLRSSLKNLKTMIVDEVHELYSNKRGAQLCVALERIEEVAGSYQRVGISATIGNAETAAEFLCGARRCKIIEAGAKKNLEITIEMPSKPKKQYPQFKETFGLDNEALARIELVAELIRESESTLMFANTRQVVESLGSKLLTFDKIEPFGGISVHHSSLDKDERIIVENQFKEGIVRSIIATSSLELGIDIGKINLVIQYGSPRQTIRLLQRAGRGGHNVGGTSKGVIVVASMLDALESAAVVAAVKERQLEKAALEEAPLDVLANQICAILLEYKKIKPEKIYGMVKRSASFAKLSRDAFDSVVKFCDDAHLIRLRADECGLGSRTREYFFSNISVIPDVARFYVKNVSNNRIISTLDERFVSKYVDDGSVFITKGLPWKVISLEKDTIFVAPSTDLEAAVPDWEGEDIPVSHAVAGRVFGLLDDDAISKVKSIYEGKTFEEVHDFVKSQHRYFTPSSDAIVIEELENYAIMYAPLGKLANELLAKIIGTFAAASMGKEVIVKSMPYAIILDYAGARKRTSLVRILESIKSYDTLSVAKSTAFIANSELFRWKFIQIAKLFGVVDKKAAVTRSGAGKIIDFYRQSPIFGETIRDLSKNYFDYATVEEFVNDLKLGKISVKVFQQTDSPLSKELLRSVLYYRELLLPVMPSDKEVENFSEDFRGKKIAILCTYCGMVFNKETSMMKDNDVHCISCGSPMVVMHSDDREAVIKKKLEGKRVTRTEQASYETMNKEAGIIGTYGNRALIALSTYGIGLTTAGRMLKLLRTDYKQFYVDLLEAQKTFIKNKKFWQTN